jgi:hypothetical protein
MGAAAMTAAPGEAPVTIDARVAIDDAQARGIVASAIDRYVAARHTRVKAFVDAHFSVAGSLRLHRRAFGADLLRAPANVALVLPHLVIQLGAGGLGWCGARRAAGWLKRRKLFLDTDVARELTWLLHEELLELPYDDGRRQVARDALAAEVLADPEVAAAVEQLEAMVRRQRDDPSVRSRLRALLDTYTGTRNAAADLVNNALLAGTGAAVFQKLTPGTLTLGPVLAATIAHQAAVASFPFGAGLGSLWYALFPIRPSLQLIVGTTGGLMLLAAALAAFAGVVSDPLQRALGLHERRLHRLIDALGQELRGDSEAAFRVRDHYVARIFDLIDLARASYRPI